MAVQDSVTKARERGASDTQILNKIIEQNPKVKASVDSARSRKASDSQILAEIIKQNSKSIGEPIQSRQAEAKTTFQESSGVGGKIAGFFGRATGSEELGRGLGRTVANIAGVDEDLAETQAQDVQTTDKLLALYRRLPQGEQKDRVRKLLTEQGTQLGETAATTGEALTGGLTNRDVGASALRTGLTVASAGFAGATPAARIGVGTTMGGGFGAANAIQNANSIEDVIKDVALGAGIGAATSGVLEIGRAVVRSGVPKLLSYTSKTPERVLHQSIEAPSAQAKSLSYLKRSGENADDVVLQKLRGATGTMRKQLSQEYDDGMNVLINKFEGQRMGLNSAEQAKLNRLVRDFPLNFDDLPADLNNMSVKESLQLHKALNSLLSAKRIREDAVGAPVRALQKQIRDKIITNFGGKNGLTDQFLKNYATKKIIVDNAMDIVAFGKGIKPTQAARTAIMKAARNKPAYIQALTELGDAMGVNLVDDVMAFQILPLARQDFGGTLGGQLINLIGTPLTSPRLAAFEARTIGTLLNAADATGLRPVLRAILLNTLIRNNDK